MDLIKLNSDYEKAKALYDQKVNIRQITYLESSLNDNKANCNKQNRELDQKTLIIKEKEGAISV